MKCPSCKYEKRTQTIEHEEMIRYKSGKRKGEVKDVVNTSTTVYKDDPNFIELKFEKDVDRIGYDGDVFWSNFEEATLMCCPQCGTVFIKEVNCGY